MSDNYSLSINNLFLECKGANAVTVALNKFDMTSIFLSVVDPIFKSKSMTQILCGIDYDETESSKLRYQIAIVIFKYLTVDCRQVKQEISGLMNTLFLLKCELDDILDTFHALHDKLLNWLATNKIRETLAWEEKFTNAIGHVTSIVCLKKFVYEKPLTLEDKRDCNSVIDKSRYSDMHYSDDKKISALEFSKESEIESELIDDLSDYENEMSDALYEDELLTSNMVELSSNVLEHYSKLLNQTVEFKDLAYCIETITVVLANLDLKSFDAKQSKKLKIYLENIISDLSDWKDKMFIACDTLDIHYLDASMLSSCAQIEMLVSPTAEEEDDDELELF